MGYAALRTARLLFTGGLMLASLLLGGRPADAGTWREAQTDHFIVYSDGSQRQLEDFAAKLETFDAVLRVFTRTKTEPEPLKTLVLLLPSSKAVQGLMRDNYGGNSRNVAGFYRSLLGRPVAVVDRSRADHEFDMDGQIVLFHEHVHAFMWSMSGQSYPSWYVEGFAEYFSTVKIRYKDEVEIEVGRPAVHRVPTLALDRWMPVERLFQADLGTLDGDETSMPMRRAG